MPDVFFFVKALQELRHLRTEMIPIASSVKEMKGEVALLTPLLPILPWDTDPIKTALAFFGVSSEADTKARRDFI